MPSRPWYKWFPGDYESDTSHLTLTQDALYRRILDELWKHGPMPRDVAYIAKRIRVERRVLERNFPVISRFFPGQIPLLDHPKIAAQRTEYAKQSGRRRESYPQAPSRTRSRSISKKIYPDAGARARESHDATDATPIWQMDGDMLYRFAKAHGISIAGLDHQSAVRKVVARMKQKEAH